MEDTGYISLSDLMKNLIMPEAPEGVWDDYMDDQIAGFDADIPEAPVFAPEAPVVQDQAPVVEAEADPSPPPSPPPTPPHPAPAVHYPGEVWDRIKERKRQKADKSNNVVPSSSMARPCKSDNPLFYYRGNDDGSEVSFAGHTDFPASGRRIMRSCSYTANLSSLDEKK